MDDARPEPVATECEQGDTFERKPIELRDDEKVRVVKESLDAVSRDIYQKGGELVWPLRQDGEMNLVAITPEALDLMLNKRIAFRKWEERGRGNQRQWQPVQCGSPKWLASQLCNLQTWENIRRILSVSRVPYLRPNGTIGGMKPGYDGPSKCWSVAEKQWLDVTDKPSDEEAKKALDVLAAIVEEFPFSDDSGLSVFLSALLAIAGRRAIKGPVPLIAIEASAPASGKTLLASVISQIATGKSAGAASMTSDEAELRKAIPGHLLSGEAVIVFDNCVGRFGGAVLDRWITSTVWTDRLLGGNVVVSLPSECVVMMTGNNSQIMGDTASRAIGITLCPKCDRPEERVFRRPSLLKHVEERQPELIHAVLTILRWHIGKGMPVYPTSIQFDSDGNKTRTEVRPFTRFEEWSQLVRHAVIGLGLPDPVQSAESIRKIDEVSARRGAFLEALAAWNPKWEGTANSLTVELYRPEEDSRAEAKNLRMAVALLTGEKQPQGHRVDPKDLGYALREIKGRFFSGLTLRWVMHRVDGTVYRLESKPAA